MGLAPLNISWNWVMSTTYLLSTYFMSSKFPLFLGVVQKFFTGFSILSAERFLGPHPSQIRHSFQTGFYNPLTHPNPFPKRIMNRVRKIGPPLILLYKIDHKISLGSTFSLCFTLCHFTNLQ